MVTGAARTGRVVRRGGWLWFWGAVIITQLAVSAAPVTPAAPPVPLSAQALLDRLPLSFEPNLGQVDARVTFLARSHGLRLFLTPSQSVLTFPRGGSADLVAPMEFVGADPAVRVVGEEALPGKVNYLLGRDSARWRTDIPTFARVRYRAIYPGIDLIYYGRHGRIEYDFVVEPGAEPSDIRLRFPAAEALSLDADGSLLVRTAGQTLRYLRPLAYQERWGWRDDVPAEYRIEGADTVRFRLGAYDRARRLVIDPVLVYATYLGGSDADSLFGVAVDSFENAYVTGFSRSSDFPSPTRLTPFNATEDILVVKVNASGTAIVYATLFGGTSDDEGHGIAVDAAGNAFIAGQSASFDYPTTPGAFQNCHSISCTAPTGTWDFVVAKLNPDGNALVYSTFIGRADDNEHRASLAIDGAGHAYVTGATLSPAFPTANAVQPAFGGGTFDAVVVKLDPAGSGLVYSTFLGGEADEKGFGIAVDPSGNAYVTGRTTSLAFPIANALQPAKAASLDAFVTKLNAAGTAFVYSTYLGGDNVDMGDGIKADATGHAYVVGTTQSTDFPTVGQIPGAQGSGADAFVAKLDPAGAALIYSTYVGGNNHDFAHGIAVDPGGNASIVGETFSTAFPLVSPVQSVLLGDRDAFVVTLNGSGSALTLSTFLGGSGTDIGVGVDVHPGGNVYVAGRTFSTDFPVTAGVVQPALGGGADGFLAMIGGSSSRRSGGRYNVMGRPIASSARQPKSRSAPRFQLTTPPSRVMPMMASSEDSTMAASRRRVSSVRFRSATTAAKASAIVAVTPTNIWSSTRDSFGESRTKGPYPLSVPHRATAASSVVTVAVSRGPNRKAAQTRIGVQRKSSGNRLLSVGSQPPNTTMPTSRSAASRPASSAVSPQVQDGRGWLRQSRSSGAAVSTPAASPSHQVTQMDSAPAQGAKPPRNRLAVPTVALIVVATRPARNAALKTSRGRSKQTEPPAQRRTSQAPATPSSVLPHAMPRDTAGDPAVRRLTRNAPRKTPGQTVGPRTSRAASASPEGGQTAVTLGCTKARRSPSLPATTYRQANPAMAARRRMSRAPASMPVIIPLIRLPGNTGARFRGLPEGNYVRGLWYSSAHDRPDTGGKAMTIHLFRSGGVALLFALGSSLPCVAAAEPAPGAPSTPLYDNLGSLHHPITTSAPLAQRYFDQGLRLVYAFNHEEAVRAFEEAARLDPKAPMPWWGIAYALGPNYNAPMGPQAAHDAHEAIQKATARTETASEAERAYIYALATRYSPGPKADRRALDQAYAAAMRRVAARFPDDPDAGTLFAEALMDLRPWDLWTADGRPQPGTEEIVATLEAVLSRHPDHPGACHYYIHAVEASPAPERALACARRLPDLMPGAGHMVHMPAHLYLRLGMYAEAAERNIHAVAADREYLGHRHPSGLYPMVYYPHNIHFLWAARLMEGRSAEARRAARELAETVPFETAMQEPAMEAFTAAPLFGLVRLGRWTEILDAPAPPEELRLSRGIWHFARGLALAAGGRLQEAGEERSRLTAIAAAVPKDRMVVINPAATLLAIAERMLAGEVAGRARRQEEGIRLLQEAVRLEDGLRYMEPAEWPLPVRHWLGAALLDAGRPAEAEAAYREDLQRNRENGWALFGLAQALRAQGKADEAADVEARFRRAWAKADLTLTASRL